MKVEGRDFRLVEVPDVFAVLKDWVRESRQSENWTQADLARCSGVPATTISRLERTGLVSTDAFRDERALKSFRGIAPTYSRLFAGFHDWTKEAMDAFAGYYDATFRKAGTTPYLVPGRMPVVTVADDIDCRASRPGSANVYDDLYGCQVIGDSSVKRHGRMI